MSQISQSDSESSYDEEEIYEIEEEKIIETESCDKYKERVRLRMRKVLRQIRVTH